MVGTVKKVRKIQHWSIPATQRLTEESFTKKEVILSVKFWV